MSHIVIIGAGMGGMSAACEIKATLGCTHRVTMVGDGDQFSLMKALGIMRIKPGAVRNQNPSTPKSINPR